MTGAPETATQLDAAIDSLLREQGPARPTSEGELTATARMLREALPRFHPRFSFEEHLATRLAVLRRASVSSQLEAPIPIPLRSLTDADDADDGADELDAADRRRRGLVAGGAIASGVSLAIPIAGAALVVWRRSRSSGGLL